MLLYVNTELVSKPFGFLLTVYEFTVYEHEFCIDLILLEYNYISNENALRVSMTVFTF